MYVRLRVGPVPQPHPHRQAVDTPAALHAVVASHPFLRAEAEDPRTLRLSHRRSPQKSEWKSQELPR